MIKIPLPFRFNRWRVAHRSVAILLVLLFAVVGSVMFAASRAATPYVALEVEKGTVAHGAKVLSDTAASSGQAVQFAAASEQFVCIPAAPVVAAGGGRQVAVSTSAGLKAALADARAGDVITMAAGTYEDSTQFAGNIYASFGLVRSGTAEAPITLTGPREAKIRGNGTGGRYGFELYGVQHVILQGFTVFEGSKGIMLDGSSNNIIDGVLVDDIGAEGVHFRALSSDNIIRNSIISDTGVDKPNFGEGVYVGSAGDNNWKVYACDHPDTSDRNQVINNDIIRARAESVDIKEGTTATIVQGNRFTGDQAAAQPSPFGENSGDSWVDAKGNDALISDNIGTNSLNHGFETHSPSAVWYRDHPETPRVAWGARNVFRNNTANVNNAAAAGNPYYEGGYGFKITNSATLDDVFYQLDNVVECNDTVTGAVLGFANIACKP